MAFEYSRYPPAIGTPTPAPRDAPAKSHRHGIVRRLQAPRREDEDMESGHRAHPPQAGRSEPTPRPYPKRLSGGQGARGASHRWPGMVTPGMETVRGIARIHRLMAERTPLSPATRAPGTLPLQTH